MPTRRTGVLSLGLQLEKFQHVDFGRCPRVYCQGQPCLPGGQSGVRRRLPAAAGEELERLMPVCKYDRRAAPTDCQDLLSEV